MTLSDQLALVCTRSYSNEHTDTTERLAVALSFPQKVIASVNANFTGQYWLLPDK